MLKAIVLAMLVLQHISELKKVKDMDAGRAASVAEKVRTQNGHIA